jgi:RNA polymerase sigma factor (sigma-70 family)
MEQTLSTNVMTSQQDESISEVVRHEKNRLRNFIRSRVEDPLDAEDILQEVFYELILAYRLMKPVEQVGAWLFRVARNRITDRFRKKKPDASLDSQSIDVEDGESLLLRDMLPSPDDGPDAAYARSVLVQELEEALDDLPKEQREVFIAHEIEGRSFKDLAAETGVSVNTLLSRKRYAVLHLREQLQEIYDEFEPE